MPVVAAHEGAGRVDEAAESLGASFRVIFITAAILTAGVAALGPPLISLAYGPDFLDAAHLVPLLSLGIVASTTAMLFWSFAQGAGRLHIPIASASVAAVADLGLAFALVGPWGATGAAVANAVAQYVLLFAIAAISRRAFPHFRAGMRRLVPPVTFCVLLGLSCIWLVRRLGYDDAGSALVSLLVGGAVAGAATVAYGTLVGFVRGPDVAWLRSSLPSSLGRFMFLVTAPRRSPGAGDGIG
jgi:O-antigen/teichoic acid export membrane protein